MKRLFIVVVLTLCLSLPVFAGHTLPGDWRECGGFAECICDPGRKVRFMASRLDCRKIRHLIGVIATTFRLPHKMRRIKIAMPLSAELSALAA